MFKKLFGNYLYPIATLMGSIIGVGFLSLPYITLKVGLWPMLAYFTVLAGIVLYINLIFVKICLATPNHKRFPGFVEFYLGRRAKNITLASSIFGSLGVLLAYLFVGGGFLANVAQPLFGGSAFAYITIYFALASLVVLVGPGANTKLDFWGLGLFLGILAIISVVGSRSMDIGRIASVAVPFALDWKTAFLPYGAILFSLWGTGMIPQVEEMLGSDKKLLRRVVIISTLVVSAIYLAFIFLVLSLSGNGTTDSALAGLAGFFPAGIALVVLSIGVITTFIAFISQGIFLKEIFIYDMGLNPFQAWVLTCFVPMALLLCGFNSFIALISLVGGVLLGINGIFTLRIYREIGGSRASIYPLIIFFMVGIVYEILFFIK